MSDGGGGSAGAPSSSPAPGKISFSLARPSPAQQKKSILAEEEEKHDEPEYITSMVGNTIVSTKPKDKDKKGPLVIPLSSGWSMTEASNQQSSDAMDVEPASATPVGPVSSTAVGVAPTAPAEPQPEQFGLVERKGAAASRSATPAASEPLLMKNRPPRWQEVKDMDELDKFKHDISHRPDDVGTDTYERVPVEAFGEALLRGMGWQPGSSIGLSGTGPVSVVEFVPRNHRLGLGAEPKMPEPTPEAEGRKRILKPGDSREPKPTMVYKDKDGRTRHVKSIDDQLVEHKAKEISYNSNVYIVGGDHSGMSGRVISMSKKPILVVLLDKSDVEVLVHESHLSLEEPENHHHHHHSHHSSHHDRKSDDHKHSKHKSRSRSRSRDRDYKHHSHSSSSHKRKDYDDHPDANPPKKAKHSESSSSRKPINVWVRNDIRVRIVSKSIKDGKFYCKKARVLDVVSGSLCSVAVEPERLVVEVDQRDLETVMPVDGGYVAVVRGEYKGQLAKLLSRDKRDSTVQIQLLEDLDVVQVSMDDVAEYMGPLNG